MHRGNILVRRTRDPSVVFVMNGQRYELPSHGVLVTVIDYTLSRLSQGVASPTTMTVGRGGGDCYHTLYKLHLLSSIIIAQQAQVSPTLVC